MFKKIGPPYAQSYRLRPARQKKRVQKEDFERRLIQLHKQEVKLWTDRKKLPRIPLAEPYQKGWKRFFVLREDVKGSNNAAFYQDILDMVNTIQYSKDKGQHTIVHYVYTEPWRFVLQIRPHMITHIKMLDQTLEQKMQHLGNYI